MFAVPYSAVIFDLDDTLVITARIKWEHHRAVARQCYGIELTDDTLRHHWGLPFDRLVELLYERADTVENMRAANFALEHQFPKGLQPGARELVADLLDAEVAICVLTAVNRYQALHDLALHNFPVDRFLHIQCADDTPVHKPDPAVFGPTLDVLDDDCVTTDLVYIGDSLDDFWAAHGAGIDFIGVTTGFVDATTFEAHGARCVACLDDLRPLLLPGRVG